MNRHAIAAATLSFVLMLPAGEAFSQQAGSDEAEIGTIGLCAIYSHPVLFVRDVDGVWRIKSF